MKETISKLICICLMIILIKIVLVLLVSTPTIYTDEYIYIKMAQNFFQDLNLKVHSIPTSNYHPIYPIIISISFISNNATVAYILMKILNVITSTLIIIPAYLFAKEFLDDKKSVVTATIITLLPMNFVFPAFIMAENMFYSLFLTSLYLIYKSLTTKSYKYDILAGISIALTYMTRFAGISLIIIVTLLLVYKLTKKEFGEIPKKITMGITALLSVSPWVIRNILLMGFSSKGLIGQYTNEISKQAINYPINIIYWIFLYGSYFLLASFIIIIFAFSNIKEKLKEEKMRIFTLLTIITLVTILVGTAQHATNSWPKETTDLPGLVGRPIGRYADTSLPILFLLGAISYYKYKKRDKKSERNILLASIPLIFLTSQLLYFKLLPANNITLTLLGSANEFMKSFLPPKVVIILLTAFLFLILFIIFLITKKSKLNILKPMTIVVLFSITTSAVAYGGIIYNSKTNWENNPQIELSRWIGDNINKNAKIVIDEDYCGVLTKTAYEVLCTKGKSTSLIALWILNPVDIKSIENTDAEYIITLKKLNLRLVKKTENNIYFYKNESMD